MGEASEFSGCPGREGIMSRILEFVDNKLSGGEHRSLFLCGQPGTGKTTCAGQVLRTYLDADERGASASAAPM